MAKTKPEPMMHMIPLKGAHFRQIKLPVDEGRWFEGQTDAQLAQVDGNGVAIMLDDVPLLLVHILPIWPDRAYVSYVLNEQDAKAERFGELLDYARVYLEGLPQTRLEMSVEIDFAAGHQLARSLGFDLEAKRMRGFLPNGRDCSLYALYRGQ